MSQTAVKFEFNLFICHLYTSIQGLGNWSEQVCSKRKRTLSEVVGDNSYLMNIIDKNLLALKLKLIQKYSTSRSQQTRKVRFEFHCHFLLPDGVGLCNKDTILLMLRRGGGGGGRGCRQRHPSML